MMDHSKAKFCAQQLASEHDADVLIYNGDIDQMSWRLFTDTVLGRRRSTNVILILTTPGGDPDAAFKIGRTLQNCYSHVTIFVPGWCKSAGTLVAIAAHELVIGDLGELGPLDIQIAKSDEIMELGSGLTVDAALKALELTASRMFINLLINLRRDTGGGVTTKTAADLAATMVTGLLEPVYRQIDPIKIGENSRAMNITKGYGSRLNHVSKNLRTPEALDFLVSAYPDHSFVIDRTEASGIFSKVLKPNELFTNLAEALGSEALLPTPGLARKEGLPYIEYLSSEITTEGRSESDAKDEASSRPRKVRRSGARKPRTNGSASPAAFGSAQ
jgi:Serine dehydrogenase proteinase